MFVVSARGTVPALGAGPRQRLVPGRQWTRARQVSCTRVSPARRDISCDDGQRIFQFRTCWFPAQSFMDIPCKLVAVPLCTPFASGLHNPTRTLPYSRTRHGTTRGSLARSGCSGAGCNRSEFREHPHERACDPWHCTRDVPAAPPASAASPKTAVGTRAMHPSPATAPANFTASQPALHPASVHRVVGLKHCPPETPRVLWRQIASRPHSVLQQLRRSKATI